MQYGGNAVFVFERSRAASLDDVSVTGSLSAFVKLAAIEISGDASVEVSDTKRDAMDRISVKYYGDFLLPSNPTTFEEGIEAVRKMPTLVREGRAPMRAFLLPLSILDSKATRIVRMVSESLVSELGDFYHNLSQIITASNHMLDDELARDLPAWSAMVSRFVSAVSVRRQALAAILSEQLPKVRGSGSGEAELLAKVDTLRRADNAPLHVLRTWVSAREVELAGLTAHVNSLCKHVGVTRAFRPAKLANQLARGASSDIAQLEVQIPTTLVAALQDRGELSNNGIDIDLPPDGAPALGARSCIDTAMLRLGRFAASNEAAWKDRDTLARVLFSEAAPIRVGSTPRVVMWLHKTGDDPREFDVPMQPADVIVNPDARCGLVVSWKPPKAGSKEIRNYVIRIEVEDEKEHDSSDVIERRVDGSKTELCMDGLKAGKSYAIRVCGETALGTSPFSDVVRSASVTSGFVLLENRGFPGHVLDARHDYPEGQKALHRYLNFTEPPPEVESSPFWARWHVQERGGAVVTLRTDRYQGWCLDANHEMVSVRDSREAKMVYVSDIDGDVVQAIWRKRNVGGEWFTLESMRYQWFYLTADSGSGRVVSATQDTYNSHWRILQGKM